MTLVVVGVTVDQAERVLITRRSAQQSYAGLWEFPGGKVEANESLEAALSREMQEEVGLQIQTSRYLGDVETHDNILLKVFLIPTWSGEARCLEGQPALAWVKWDDLSAYTFPKANEKIVDMICQEFRHASRCSSETTSLISE